ncbi:MAG TPA: penicillin-binding protein [Candidatus Mediterraneibacter ornithocaccae]|jgi:penicillin-binding protein 2|uniref:penicillin-binding transpeptidase domain-containing protein n=1 Tax=Mediterraneibacter glycyrrhizinilyticus TaxID=342942 RepID=UPI0019CF65A3|nr:penicillin-binding transpeptidase domain-containing protein [Mediterraneibacter glycyrrhizinilyticus]MDN0043890.1 penicillin-binding transpeptidase domain-containing protein [Mediterraneibacter glycyrrhizinilyticus]MDN0061650.1 penicillin-binding transpeptidase domain-containing protein [Mediterraneibacter glycyrrhizinilyticus]HJA19752.1 penicillin-binding protein [Candidatus Mediterraneibacter ornithocaccae]
MKSRLMVLIIVFCLTSSVLIGRLFYLQIVRGEEYLENYELQIRRTSEIAATRGNIYDRNGNLLAYNELAYSVTIQDTVPTNTSSEDKNEILNNTLDQVLSIVENNGDSVIDSFGIILDSAGNYQFAETNETLRLRFIADVYGQAYTDDLTEEQKNQSASGIMHHLCSKRYGLDDENNDPEYILKMVNMRYAMGLNSYQQFLSTTLASDVSDETVAAIMENQSKLNGVDIEEESLRRYPDGKYFASIIGYIGPMSQDEYDNLAEDEKDKYSLSDLVGKSGIEQAFDSTLQGVKGKSTFYVDNLGKIIETVSRTDPKAGNDIYLTIDKDLQINAYNLLEEKIAGIVLSKLTNILDYDPSVENDASDIIIPISDAYHAFIANEVIDMDHFANDEAGTAEKAVYAVFQNSKESTLSGIMSQLESPDSAAYKDLSDEMKAYMSYICNDVLADKTGILLTSEIDTSDETYIAWRTDETISLNAYLNYAISQNWIDTSKLGDSAYSSSEEIYQALLTYIEEYLTDDSDFDKLLYEYLIKSGSVTGTQICAIVYEQGVLPMDEDAYNGLLRGTVDSYGWLHDKIQSLEITPGQLGLEPGSGGLVVTDPNTGDVLACVSYPGYDNNRLANTMDSAYYNQLNSGTSRPFYNRATQEETAPGSTFKMVSATAGLEEGIVDASTTFSCNGVFSEVQPSPRCWVYPNGHGSLNAVGAIENSCNVYFYNVGYELGMDSEGNYDSTRGTDRLAKYAEMYGLGEKSGLEIDEAAPHISDEYSIQSAIGQGNNNFTVSQLNRYVTAVANRGTVYDLTLIDKVTDSSGSLLRDNEAEVVRTMDDISSSTWDQLHQGMELMVSSHATFSGLDFSMAGKTGTAQQNELHADHALFVGYAPADSPEISVAVRIVNGYNSGYASEIGRDVSQIYFNPDLKDKLITGEAANLGSEMAGD